MYQNINNKTVYFPVQNKSTANQHSFSIKSNYNQVNQNYFTDSTYNYINSRVSLVKPHPNISSKGVERDVFINKWMEATPIYASCPYSIEDLKGESNQNHFLFPPAPIINQHSDVVQAEMIDLAQEFSLCPEKVMQLEAQKFAFLSGSVSPFLSKNGLRATSIYLYALFDHDDYIDSEGTQINLDKLKNINDQIMDVMKGKPCPKNAPNRVIAFSKFYEQYIKDTINDATRENYNFFITTLNDYLKSTEVEEQLKNYIEPIDTNCYLENRQHTGGGRNLFALHGLLQDINVSEINQKHILTTSMLRFTMDCVGLLNDMYSAPKEIKEIQKKLAILDKDPNNEEEFKKYVTSNLVLLKFKEGYTLKRSMDYVNQLYLSRMKSFFLLKTLLKPYLANDEKLRQYVFELECWFWGHPLWALNSGRYNKNKESNLSVQQASAFAHNLKKQ